MLNLTILSPQLLTCMCHQDWFLCFCKIGTTVSIWGWGNRAHRGRATFPDAQRKHGSTHLVSVSCLAFSTLPLVLNTKDCGLKWMYFLDAWVPCNKENWHLHGIVNFTLVETEYRYRQATLLPSAVQQTSPHPFPPLCLSPNTMWDSRNGSLPLTIKYPLYDSRVPLKEQWAKSFTDNYETILSKFTLQKEKEERHKVRPLNVNSFRERKY